MSRRSRTHIDSVANIPERFLAAHVAHPYRLWHHPMRSVSIVRVIPSGATTQHAKHLHRAAHNRASSVSSPNSDNELPMIDAMRVSVDGRLWWKNMPDAFALSVAAILSCSHSTQNGRRLLVASTAQHRPMPDFADAYERE